MPDPGRRTDSRHPAPRLRHPGTSGVFSALAALTTALTLWTAAGCQSDPPAISSATEPAEIAVPNDLVLDVTVLRGRRVEGTIGVERHQARYILFADGSLHADAGRSLRADVRPGLTRRLSGEKMQLVWRTLKEVGLDVRAGAGDPGNDTLVEAPADRVVHLLNVGVAGDTWRILRLSSEDGSLPSDTTRMVRLLAELAWVPDEFPQRRAQAAVRYDFGPDPYAMFRREESVRPGDIERRPSAVPRVPPRILFPLGAPR